MSIDGENMQILINGKVLFRKITGIERYAHETILEIDKKIKYHQYKLVIPAHYDDTKLPHYNNLEIIKLEGIKKDFLWEQISLPIYAHKNNGIIVNFDFSTPVFSPGISTIHDISFHINKNYFNQNIRQWLVRIKLELYCYSLARSKYPIFTVSEFQKEEIIHHYHINPDKIIVAGNAWQHFQLIHEDDSVLAENQIESGKYFFSLSSNTENKNFKWIYEAAKVNPESKFIIVGGSTSISSSTLKKEKNILYLGYQSDERVKSLYKNCKAFIFPSFYEGFGIPPMEALSVGSKIIISNSSCLPEIYENTAYYINPNNPRVNLDEIMSNKKVDDASKVLNKFTWTITASKWIEILEKYRINRMKK